MCSIESAPVRPLAAAWPQAAAALFIAVAIWFWYTDAIHVGGISMWDEFAALDRATSFSRHDDWFSVYSGNEVVFRKPPLKYWMSALLLEAGVDQTVALRLPSFCFALCALIATGLLAWAIVPHSPWVMPIAVLLHASSLQFWQFATSAMLDSGAALFTTLTLAAMILALRQPRWWYVTALATGLGAWQKAPVPLLLVAICLTTLALTSSLHGYTFRSIRRNPHFRRSIWIALIGTFAWPSLQALRHGYDAFDIFYVREMFERFIPDPLSETPRHYGMEDLVIAGEPYLRWAGIVAILWLPWCLRRHDLHMLPILVVVQIVATYFASGQVYPRYSLLMLPLLAAALAAILVSVLRRRWLAAAGATAISALSLGPIKPYDKLRLEQNESIIRQVAVLSRFGASLRQEERAVYCDWDRETRFLPGAFSYYASGNKPFVKLGTQWSIEHNIATGKMKGPLRGICTSADLDSIAARLVGLERVRLDSGYVIWTASGAN